MKENILTPKWSKNKKPTKKRKPSKPLDGINYRLLREQAKESAILAVAAPADSAPPTRAELETKANELGIKFDGRTPDKKLGNLIVEKLAKV